MNKFKHLSRFNESIILLEEVQIGNQIWTKDNLKVTQFRNGDDIKFIKDDEAWSKFDVGPAMCINPYTGEFLYNWYAVNDPRGLAPEGWHVPEYREWSKLFRTTGGVNVAGEKMKSSPSDSPSWDGTNDFGFSALPTGMRDEEGIFQYNSSGNWWFASPDECDPVCWLSLRTGYKNASVEHNGSWNGFAVRCVRD